MRWRAILCSVWLSTAGWPQAIVEADARLLRGEGDGIVERSQLRASRLLTAVPDVDALVDPHAFDPDRQRCPVIVIPIDISLAAQRQLDGVPSPPTEVDPDVV